MMVDVRGKPQLDEHCAVQESESTNTRVVHPNLRSTYLQAGSHPNTGNF